MDKLTSRGFGDKSAPHQYTWYSRDCSFELPLPSSSWALGGENDQRQPYGNHHFPVGKVHMNSDQALGFVRERYSLQGGDNDRGKIRKGYRSSRKKLTSTSAEELQQLFRLADCSRPIWSCLFLTRSGQYQLESGEAVRITSHQRKRSYGFTIYAMPDSISIR